MNQDQCTAGPCRDEEGADDGLPDTRRRNEYPDIMSAQRIGGRPLHVRQFSVELKSHALPAGALIFNLDRNPMIVQERLQLALATPRQRDELRQLLGACDHSRVHGR